MKLIHRSLYLQKLIDVIGTPDIKVITGVRRSGKSKLLEAFKDYIQKTDANANLIHVNFNLLEFQSLTTYEKLNSYVESKFVEGKNNFVLIDEVQMCTGFEKVIESLHERIVGRFTNKKVVDPNTKETIIETIESSNDKDFELPF